MRSPAVPTRVRANGRKDGFIPVPFDPLACVTDIFALVDKTIIEKTAPFSLLPATRERDGAETGFPTHDERIAAVRESIRSSTVHLRQSHTTLADLQDSIRVTLRMIQTSQELIFESDRIIARAHCSSYVDNSPTPVTIT